MKKHILLLLCLLAAVNAPLFGMTSRFAYAALGASVPYVGWVLGEQYNRATVYQPSRKQVEIEASIQRVFNENLESKIAYRFLQETKIYCTAAEERLGKQVRELYNNSPGVQLLKELHAQLHEEKVRQKILEKQKIEDNKKAHRVRLNRLCSRLPFDTIHNYVGTL